MIRKRISFPVSTLENFFLLFFFQSLIKNVASLISYTFWETVRGQVVARGRAG